MDKNFVENCIFFFRVHNIYGEKVCCAKSVNIVLFVCVGVLRPSQQRGHVEPVS